ncbi:hypothetical protein [Pantoea dispersa]|uniref:hypothetical protein n=1 Tax=Pantoea dispersa TaxID=59814 RepID=UPI0013313C1E|nr:hypothetical protein [Pantoea dispersa]
MAAFEHGMNLKLKSEVRLALLDEANRQGISMARLAARILQGYLINSDNGVNNPNGKEATTSTDR